MCMRIAKIQFMYVIINSLIYLFAGCLYNFVVYHHFLYVCHCFCCLLIFLLFLLLTFASDKRDKYILVIKILQL